MSGDKGRINSRAKGSEYERKVAKELGNWWGEEFHRTPMSGGLHWKKDNRVAGDIVTPPDSVYPFVTECKKREGWSFEQLLKGTGEVEKWWKQVTRDSSETGLYPLLIFAKNFSPDYVMIQMTVYMLLFQNYREHIEDAPRMATFTITLPDDEQGGRVILLLDDFLSKFSKEDVMAGLSLPV